MKPVAKYKASSVEPDKNQPLGNQFQVKIFNPDDHPVMFVQGESREMVRMAAASAVAAFNKVLGA